MLSKPIRYDDLDMIPTFIDTPTPTFINTPTPPIIDIPTPTFIDTPTPTFIDTPTPTFIDIPVPTTKSGRQNTGQNIGQNIGQNGQNTGQNIGQNTGQNTGGGSSSIATYYFRVGADVPGCAPVQSFNDNYSYGPCNNGQGVKYTSDSKYWAAISNAASKCGQTITVNYNGKSMNLIVMDECPACASDNHVDMGLDALIELTGSATAACAIGTTQPMITWN